MLFEKIKRLRQILIMPVIHTILYELNKASEWRPEAKDSFYEKNNYRANESVRLKSS